MEITVTLPAIILRVFYGVGDVVISILTVLLALKCVILAYKFFV
jgi:hypothetical protein